MQLATILVSGVGHSPDKLLNHEWLPYYQGVTLCSQILLQAQGRTKHNWSALNVSVICISPALWTFSRHVHQECRKDSWENKLGEWIQLILTHYQRARGTMAATALTPFFKFLILILWVSLCKKRLKRVNDDDKCALASTNSCPSSLRVFFVSSLRLA